MVEPDAGTPDAGTEPPSWAESRFESRWVAPGFGELFSLATADLDGDGEEEVIYGGRGLAVVDPDGQRLIWSAKWDLEASSDNSWATGIRVIPSVTGDDTPDLLVSNADDQIQLVDGATGAFVWTQTTPSQLFTTHFATLDADDDGVPDLFPAFGTKAWSGATGQELWEADLPHPATFVTEASLDADGRGDLLVAIQPPEIFGGGDPDAPPEEQFFGIAADGTVLFRYAPIAGKPFGVTAADLDGDGIDEGIFVTDLGEVWAMDATGSVRWKTAAVEGALDKVVAMDVDRDGTEELFVAGMSWVDGYVVVHLASDGTVVWTHGFDDPVWSFERIRTTLFVGSGEENILSVRGKLTALDITTSSPAELWSADMPRPVRKLALAKRDGAVQVIAGQGDAILSAFDPTDGALAWNWISGAYFWDMASGDLDGDGSDEVIRGDENGYVSVWDASGKHLWTVRPNVGNAGFISGVAAGDLDGDGKLEVVTSGIRAFENDMGVVEAFSASGERLWSVVFPDQMANVQVADLDGDGLAEVIVGEVGLETCAVRVLDRAGNKVWSTPLSACADPILAVGDVDGDGVPEIGYGERVMFTPPHVALLSADGMVRWHHEILDETTWLELRDGAFIHGGISPENAGHVTRRNTDSVEVWKTPFASLPSQQFVDQVMVGHSRFATSVSDVTGDGEDDLAVSSANGTVYLVDAADGTIRWEKRLGVKEQSMARAEQAGPIAFVPATTTSPAFLAVAQSADARTRATLFALSLDGKVQGSREMEGEGQAIAVVRSEGRVAAVVGAGLGMYAVEAVPAE